MPTAPRTDKRASSQPPQKGARSQDWLQAHSTRLGAGAEIFGGWAGGSVDDAYKLLYTQTPGDALTAAQKLALAAKEQQAQSPSTAAAASSFQPKEDWVTAASAASLELKSHYEANLMQNRFGEDSPSMFNPAHHTVVVWGRLAQATLQ